MTESQHEKRMRLLQKPMLSGRNEIETAYDIGRKVFDMFVELGMPVAKINGQYYGSPESINKFFEKNLKTTKNNPGGGIEIIPTIETSEDD